MLRVQNLQRPGLRPTSFAVAAGECLAVMGASGSGKTLLLRALADLDPNEGLVELAGDTRESIDAPDWRRRVCYLPAEAGWWTDHPREHFADWSKASAMLENLSLAVEIGDQPVMQLSTGERQRLALLRTLSLDPQVLLLDEPTAALDAEASVRVEALVQQRLHAGVAVIWVTHDLSQAKRMAKRVLQLDAGKASEVEL